MSKHIGIVACIAEGAALCYRIIFNELVYGIISPDAKKFLLQVIMDFKSKGCDTVVLGCTEIPLIVIPGESPLPLLDSTRILARAALREAVG